jgi:hypothetical protein
MVGPIVVSRHYLRKYMHVRIVVFFFVESMNIWIIALNVVYRGTSIKKMVEILWGMGMRLRRSNAIEGLLCR